MAVLSTGDDARTAQTAAVGLNFRRALAEGLPAETRHLQSKRRCVAMVGEGVDDASARTPADVDITVRIGHDVPLQRGDHAIPEGQLLIWDAVAHQPSDLRQDPPEPVFGVCLLRDRHPPVQRRMPV
jgi:cation transport ATPase